MFFIFKVGKVVLETGKLQKLLKTAKLCLYKILIKRYIIFTNAQI